MICSNYSIQSYSVVAPLMYWKWITQPLTLLRMHHKILAKRSTQKWIIKMWSPQGDPQKISTKASTLWPIFFILKKTLSLYRHMRHNFGTDPWLYSKITTPHTPFEKPLRRTIKRVSRNVIVKMWCPKCGPQKVSQQLVLQMGSPKDDPQTTP